MDRTLIEPAIKTILKEMHRRLGEASATASAAIACSDANQVDNAIQIALGVEQTMYEASRLLDAASLLNRLSDR